MRTSIAILVGLGIALLAFGYWGLETESGRHAYDEMDGIIPAAAGMLGLCLLVAALVLALIYRRRLKRGGEVA